MNSHTDLQMSKISLWLMQVQCGLHHIHCSKMWAYKFF